MLTKLTLPKPSVELETLVRNLANNRIMDTSILEWHIQQQPSHINCAMGDFFTDNTLKKIASNEYKKFFNVEMIPIVGVIKNIKDVPASYPPHTDRFRSVALNYYLELGGHNVETVYYDKNEDENDTVGGNVISYSTLPSVSSVIKFDTEQWYMLPSRQYHSVENIETIRIMFSLMYVGEVNEFIDQHRHLIVGGP